MIIKSINNKDDIDHKNGNENNDSSSGNNNNNHSKNDSNVYSYHANNENLSLHKYMLKRKSAPMKFYFVQLIC